MVFKPGNNANPLGRPKRISPLSEDYQTFYEKNKEDLQKVFRKVIVAALENNEAWAMKLCLEYFCPKPERSMAVTKEETTAVSMTIDQRLETWSLEDKQTFLKVWLKNKRGVPAFHSAIKDEEMTVENDQTAEGEEHSIAESW